jgi:transcriptional regulator with XRE-family HTH domain
MDVAGLDNSGLADALGIHRHTVGNYLNGHTSPKRSDLIAIAQVTGVDLAWLEGDDGRAVTGTPTHRYRPYVTHTASVSGTHHAVSHLARGPAVRDERPVKAA